MLTNIKVDCKINLSFKGIVDPMTISISDRHQNISSVCIEDQNSIDLEFKIQFPNTLRIDINGVESDSAVVRLESMSIGGLDLSDRILEEICNFFTVDSDQPLILREWTRNGSIKIDFFAADWVQYHLLYNNKFDLVE